MGANGVKREVDPVLDVGKYLAAAIAVLAAVKKLVEEFEVPGYGPEKKQAVLDAVAALYDLGKDWIPMDKESVLKLASAFVDIIVTFYNITGVFKHSSKETPPPVEPGATKV